MARNAQRHEHLACLVGVALAAAACGSSSEGANGDDQEPRAGVAGQAGVSGSAGLSAAGAVAGPLGGSGEGGAPLPVPGASGRSSGGGGIAGSSAGAAGAATGGNARGGGAAGEAGTAGLGGATGGSASTLPAPGNYGERESLIEPNSEMAVGEVNGKIYVIGGYPSSRVVQATVQVYDPATDSWTLAAPLPFAIHHPVVIGVAGKLYSLGGQGTNADTNRTLEYDPITDSWRDRAPMPTARGAGAGAAIDEIIYVVGGRPPAGNAFEAYDVAADAWEVLPDLPQEFPDRNHLAAAAIMGKIYVAGGRHSGGSYTDPMTASLDIYDPATRAWSKGSPMLRARGGVNGIAAYGCFFVWGGEGPNTGEPNDVFPDHDVYDPAANRWTALPSLPTPVHGVTGAAFVDGLIYMPGGGTRSGGSSGSTLFQVYRPIMRCD